MYHIGHARVLEQAKKLFPHVHLIVGVSGDQETIEKKGKIVNNEWERSEILKHCRWVDEVVCPCPWIVTVDFLRKHNIHYVAHDEAPYGGEGQEDIYADVKKLVSLSLSERQRFDNTHYTSSAISMTHEANLSGIGYVQGNSED